VENKTAKKLVTSQNLKKSGVRFRKTISLRFFFSKPSRKNKRSSDCTLLFLYISTKKACKMLVVLREVRERTNPEN
jgi:hypothetical protein